MEAGNIDEWKVLDSYFNDNVYPFTKHHLDSFRQFVREQVPSIIKAQNPITMVKLTDDKQELLKVEIFIGGDKSSINQNDMDSVPTCDNIYIDRPTILDADGKPLLLTPMDARMRNLTYETHVYADILVKFTYIDNEADDDDTDNKRVLYSNFPRKMIASFPLMLHSEPCILHQQPPAMLRQLGECPYDNGGYFIIDGKEKVIVSQERISTNRLFVDISRIDPNFSYIGLIRCTPPSGNNLKTIKFYLLNQDKTKLRKEWKKYSGSILVSILGFAGYHPIAHLFRALGVESDMSILEHIYGKVSDIDPIFLEFLRPSLSHAKVFSQEDALAYFTDKLSFEGGINYVKSILINDLFPNIHTPNNELYPKARYLGYLINKFSKIAMKINPVSDRDSYIFKRVDLSGFLISQLFEEAYAAFVKNCRNALDREYNYGPLLNTPRYYELVRNDNIQNLIQQHYIGNTMTKSMKGMWGLDDADDPEQGKVQDLSRISYISFLSHLRRVNNPMSRSLKLPAPHRLHGQQFGIMCPFESPDGAAIGFLKNLSLLAHVTFGCSVASIHECLEDLGVVQIDAIRPTTFYKRTAVVINGSIYGIVEDPEKLVNVLRLYRRNGLINAFVSISWNIKENEITLLTDPGRPCRPLFIVPVKSRKDVDGKSWFDLIFGTTLDKKLRTEALYYSGQYTPPTYAATANPDFQGKSHDEILKLLERNQATIEFLDIDEENTRLIAMTQNMLVEDRQFTHCEIHPSTMFGVVTNNIPFAQHNQAPRNIFHGSQSKQAIGVYTTNFSKRFDTMGYLLHYPQAPLITTRNSQYTSCDRMPNGVNAIVAIASHTGYNQEDAVIINKNSIDRGFYQITCFKTMTAQETTNEATGEKVIFTNPATLKEEGVEIKNKRASYELIDKTSGIIKEGAFIPKGQDAIVIGMAHVHSEVVKEKKGLFETVKQKEVFTDVSRKSDIHHYGVIDKVFVGTRGFGDGNKIAKVRFRKIRRPELGDKTCSRHGQKGVMGMVLPAEQMPFTKDGVIPDLIINPHAFPSRMTIGHLIECVFAKLCAMDGIIGDGSIFLPVDVDKVGTELEKNHGFEKQGNEIMYNGRTGQQIETEVFIGPTFYLRLKHMVADKLNARSTGPRKMDTHQPTSGRSAGGGLRIGEMERDVLVAYGISQFIKESMMERSDKYKFAVCKSCGTIARFAPEKLISECSTGNPDHEVVVLESPYSLKVLIQELESLGIQMRLSTELLHADEESDDEDYMNESDSDDEPKPKPKAKPKKKAEALKKKPAKIVEEDEEEEEDETIQDGGVGTDTPPPDADYNDLIGGDDEYADDDDNNKIKPEGDGYISEGDVGEGEGDSLIIREEIPPPTDAITLTTPATSGGGDGVDLAVAAAADTGGGGADSTVSHYMDGMAGGQGAVMPIKSSEPINAYINGSAGGRGNNGNSQIKEITI